MRRFGDLVQPAGGRNTYLVFDRRIRWSPWWWLSVAGVLLAVVLVVAWPVTEDFGDYGTTECGTLVAPEVAYVPSDGEVVTDDEADAVECESLRGARWHRILSVLAVSVLPWWLGRRDNATGDVPVTQVAAAVCVGVSLVLVIGPQTSHGYECGSPILRDFETIEEFEGENGVLRCDQDRSGRVGWAALWGVASVPFAVSAARGHRDDE